MERYPSPVKHEHTGRQHYSVELAEEPGLAPGGLDRPDPDLADVVQDVLLEQAAVFHVGLVIWNIVGSKELGAMVAQWIRSAPSEREVIGLSGLEE